MAAGSGNNFAEVTEEMWTKMFKKIQNVDSGSTLNIFIPQK